MQEGYNVIIVGGGIGGFSVGAFLAKRGYHVQIFDKNPIPGGYCQAFKRKGMLIHPSVLRVGAFSCADMINGYCRQLGMDDIEWLTYKEYYQFGENIKINQCTPNIDKEIARFFPEDEEQLARFFHDIRELYDIMNKIFANNMSIKGLTAQEVKKYMPALNKTAIELVEEYFESNKVLRDIILAMLELDVRSVALAIPMTYFEIKGQGLYYVPKGGAFTLIQSFKNIILERGGEVFSNTNVDRIEVEDNKAVGIVTGNKKYYGDMVISGIDINSTYQDLIGENKIENKKMLDMLQNKWKISRSCFSIWLGFDVALDELGVESGSTIFYQNANRIFEVREIMQKENESVPGDFWFQLFTAFSEDEKSTPRNKSQMAVGILIPYKFQSEWGKDNNYQEVKNSIVEMVLKCLEEKYPLIKGKYSFVEAATPITYERECGNCHGAYLGFEKYQDFVYDRKRHQNQGLLENLFFSSHWVSIIGGVNGVLQEAIKTANLIMKKYPIEGTDCEEYKLFV